MRAPVVHLPWRPFYLHSHDRNPRQFLFLQPRPSPFIGGHAAGTGEIVARTILLVPGIAALIAVAACNHSDQPPQQNESKPAAAAAAAPPPAKPRATACDMVTEAEMSSILGGAVVAKNNDHSNGKTECIYTAAEGVSPYAELSVDWGSGEGAMTAMGMMNQKEPGIADPYEGIGDQAAAVGPTLMIRTGDDLMTIVFSGVTDVPAKAKRIFETAKARM
jgi:hypothetical protein